MKYQYLVRKLWEDSPEKNKPCNILAEEREKREVEDPWQDCRKNTSLRRKEGLADYINVAHNGKKSNMDNYFVSIPELKLLLTSILLMDN